MYTPPVTSIQMSVLGPLNRPSLFDIRLNDATGALFGPAGSVFDGWCLAMNVFLNTATASQGTMYSSYELGTLSVAGLPIGSGASALDNMDSINWLINEYDGGNYTWGEVQAAMWSLLGDDWTVFAGPLGNPDPARVAALTGDALANDGFVPDAGQIIGMVMDVRDGTGGQQQPTLVEVRAAKIGDRVWEDKNADGVQDTGEAGISGAVVQLVRDVNGDGDFGDANEVLGTTTTDASGNYSFKGLTPGLEYQVQFVTPTGFNGTSPAQTSGDDTTDSDGLVSAPIVLAPSEFNASVDSGFYKFASLGDRVWLDANSNGQQDFGEGGVSGVVVNLLNSAGTVISTQTTGVGGTYLFTSLVPGSYAVEFVQPAGQGFTVADTGADGTDSDANQGSGLTGTYTLASGEINRTVDAGLVAQVAPVGTISGTVLEDRDNNDSGDVPIAGVVVVLKDATGAVVGTATTGANGSYSFTGLPAGTYTVEQTNLPTYNDVGDVDGGDPNVITVDLPAGGNSPGNDFVDDRTATLGDRVWLDANNNGQQDTGEANVADVTVNLLDGAGNVLDTQTTDANGEYLFTNLDAGTYSVQFVKPAGLEFTGANTGADGSDSDADQATGQTGTYTLASGDDNRTVDAGLVQPVAPVGTISGKVLEDKDNNNSGDMPIAGVVVVLKDATGAVVGTATTGADGSYSFTGVPAGTYTVEQTNLPTYNDVGDVDGGDPNVITVDLPAGGNSPGNDFVDDRTATLGDRVWFDANNNGQQDTGEANVADVTVNLLDSAGNVLDSQLTDASGNYLFTNLDAGTYSVQFVKPAGLEFTSANTGADGSDSDADQATGQTGTYTLASGDDNRTVDAGLVQPAPQPGSLSGTVLEDRDNNDSGDVPIAGVVIVLKDANGAEVGRTTTATDGTYSFTNLQPGDYTVEQTNLPGYNDVSDIDGGNPNSIAATVPDGGQSTGNDFVDDRPASIGDRVWLDQDGDGQQEAGDQNVEGVVVNLLDAAGAVIDTQTTDASGNYLFSNLDAGTYSVQFVKPNGYEFTVANQGVDATDSDANQITGNTGNYTLASGDNVRTVDAGLIVPAPVPGSLSGTVLEDRDNNDSGDVPIAGVVIVLKDANGAEVGRTTTATDGTYSFTNLQPGDYTVEQTNLPGYNDVSDIDGGNPNSIAATVPAGGQSTGNDFVDDRPASIGDRVWLDADGDGQQETGDQNVSGVVVNLLNAAGNIVSTQTTNSNGNYLFTNLDAGTYSVQFVKPNGYEFTVANQGVDATDSDANQITGNTGSYTLNSGDNVRTVDAGLKVPAPLPGSVSGTVLEDRDNNGTGDTPIAGVVVVLKNPAGVIVGTATTDSNGNYSFTNVPAGNYTVHQTNLPGYNDVGDKDGGDPNSIAVTVPAGGTSPGNDFVDDRPASIGDRVWLDADGDGQQETGDQNVSGVVVNLLNAAGNIVATQTTNSTGNYLFTNLDAGTYSVQFVKPNGYEFTVANQGLDATDSDANQITGNTGSYTLNSGDNVRTVDAGLKVPAPLPGSVSGTVLEDRDNNGTGDTPIAGVVIVLKNTAGVIVGQTTTDSNGNYNFSNVPAGNYTVHQTNLPGYNDVGDKDGGDPNSIAVTVPAGGTSPGNNFVDDRPASIGDRVFLDANKNGQQDAGEAGVGGVTVNLLNAAGNVVSTQTTNGNGDYLFSNLDAGTYSVQFVKPGNQDFTIANTGADGTDSDADQTTGRTGTYTLVSGESNRTVDAGLVAKEVPMGSLTGKVLEDRDNNGSGDTPIAGVTVVLKNSAGQVVGTATTGADGTYTFSNVPAGNYTVHQTNLPGYNDVGDKDGGDPNSIAATVPAGGTSTGNDFVDDRTAELGDRVFLDANKNGQQDAGEAGVGGVTVNLLNAAGNVVSTQTTNGNGDYLFSGLDAGTYSVQFVKPGNQDFTTANSGNDATDSDANQTTGRTGTYTLVSGESNRTVDAGLVAKMVEPDCVDVNFNFTGNTAVDGSDGNTRSWTNGATGVSVTARAFSQIKGTNTFEAAYLGAYGGGLGVTDKYEGSGSGTSHTVDNVGKNNYIVLQFSQAVEVDKAFLGYVSGDSDIQIWVGNASSTLTSINSSTLSSASFTELNTTSSSGTRWADLNASEVKGNIFIIAADTTTNSPNDYFKLEQLGVCVPVATPPQPTVKGSIGDRVWEDKNYNGLQDSGEAGVKGVTVKLLNSSGSVVATTTTGDSGNYVFNGLDAGNYKVQVVSPSGYYVTKQNAAGYNGTDSAVDSSGYTGTISLAAGQNVNKVDAGIYRKATIGDKVFADWNHNGVQDKGGEGAVKNVKVMLQDSTGKTIATTYTDSSGNYKFSDLNPGTYRVAFDKSKAVHVADGKSVYTWSWAMLDKGGDDSKDSDATGTYNGVATTAYTTLESGEVDNTWDVGVTPIVIDLNGDGIQTIARSDASGTFDLFGNGNAVKSGWISSGDGFLAIDIDGNGKIESSAELFGGSGKGAGFAKLGSYDSNGDGVVSAQDADFAQLMVWQDANGNHQTDDGELVSLAQAGITSLGLTLADQAFYADGEGNVHGETSTATLANGASVTMTDVYFSVDKSDAIAAGAALPTIGELLGTGTSELDVLVGPAAADCATAQMEVDCYAEAGELLRKLSALSRAEVEQQVTLAA